MNSHSDFSSVVIVRSHKSKNVKLVLPRNLFIIKDWDRFAERYVSKNYLQPLCVPADLFIKNNTLPYINLWAKRSHFGDNAFRLCKPILVSLGKKTKYTYVPDDECTCYQNNYYSFNLADYTKWKKYKHVELWIYYDLTISQRIIHNKLFQYNM